MKLLIVFLVVAYCATNIVAEADAEAKPEAKPQGIYLGGNGLYSNYGRHTAGPSDAVYSKSYGYGHNLGVLGIGHVLGNGHGNAIGYGNQPGFNHGYGLGSVAIVPYSIGAHGFGGYGLAGNGIGTYGIFGNGLVGHRFFDPRISSPVFGGHSIFSQGFPGYGLNGQSLIGHGVVGNGIGRHNFAGQGLIGSHFLPGYGFQGTGHFAQPYQLHDQSIYTVPEHTKSVSFIDAKPALGFEQLNTEKFHGLGFDSHGNGIGHQISHSHGDQHGRSHVIDHGNKHGNGHVVHHGNDDGFRHGNGHDSGHGVKAIHSVHSTHKSPSFVHGNSEHSIQGLHSVQNVQKSIPISQVLKSIAGSQGNIEQGNVRIISGLPAVQNIQNSQNVQNGQKTIQAANNQKTIQFRIINPSTPFNFEKSSDNKGFTPKFTEYKSFDSVEQY